MLDIFLVQMEIAPNDKARNFEKVETLTREIRKRTEDSVPGLIMLPEMFATGYLPLHPERAAEGFSDESSGETASFLNKLASQTGCAVMGAGISRKGPSLANHASVYLPGNPRECASYDKRKPFFMEQGKFTAGQDVSLFKIQEWNIAPTICFDLRFPELYRDAVKAGANLLTVQAAWPAERILHWDTLLQARAIENQAFVAAVNSVSADSKYNGHSRIVDPFGNIVAKADSDAECIVSARIEIEPLLRYRESFPVLKSI
ncbi:nitrilase-related carbon-nitrogen hydrolase [uncultured Fibrobacter sp.]|uniref:nitrilase-related carbon-nitrogen hydrolase n=1 Tax=uncultured Fibrobacter sp. TaxID=261512 RepID=UPI0025D7E882|nr:nitrilase-related carbon-nitrogen hydrolase [uncultured Fibrobacter sp.]